MDTNLLSLSDFDTMCRFCLLKTGTLQPVSDLKKEVCSERILETVMKLMIAGDSNPALLPKGACQSCCSIINLLIHFIYNAKMACKVLAHVLSQHNEKSPNPQTDSSVGAHATENPVGTPPETQEATKKTKTNNPPTRNTEHLFSCEVCQQTFELERALCEHERRDHQVLKPYKCRECDKAYATHTLLKVHAGTHTKPFSCDVCHKLFANKMSLKTHKLYHEGGQKCDTCGQICTSRSALTIHRRKHTGERPYACHVCGKMFPYVKNLDLHMRTHFDDYDKDVCYLCGYTSSIRSNYLKHVRRHRNERNHSCAACGKTFAENCGLTKHLKKHCKGILEEKRKEGSSIIVVR